MSRAITQNQKVILEMVANFMDDNGFPPTIRDIAREYQCSVKGAYDHVLALERKGYFTRSKLRSRGILLSEKAMGELSRGKKGSVPLYGQIAAGRPILADDNVLGALNYPRELPDTGEFFALHVKGDSMSGDGIFEGDTVYVRKQDMVESDEIAACLIDHEAALKRVIFKDGKILLRSSNPRYPDREVRERELRILGKLHGLFREY